MNSASQARNLAERLSDYAKKSKLSEIKTNKQVAKERERRDELWRQLEKSSLVSCHNWSLHLEEAQIRKKALATLDQIDKELAASAVEGNSDYANKLQVLKKLGYIDENKCLLIKGKTARELSSGDIILLAEMMFNKSMRELDPEDLVALVSTLVIQEKMDKDADVSLSDKYDAMQKVLIETAKNVHELEKACDVHLEADNCQEKLHFGLAHVIYFWAQGKDFQSVSEMTNIHEGSIVRAIMRVEYVLREMKNAAGIMGDSKMKELATIAQERIKRDIIFTPSLYIQ